MPVLASYLTVEAFKARVGRTVSTTEQDAEIAAAIEAASRQVDGFCGRPFGQSDAPEPRVFDAATWPEGVFTVRQPAGLGWPGGVAIGLMWQGSTTPVRFEIGDHVAVTEVSTDAGPGNPPVVWDPALYVASPRGAAAKARPYRAIVAAPGQWWPSQWIAGPYAITVTATWGWPLVPGPVREATFLQANRLKSLWTAPFGVTGTGEMGQLQEAVSLSPILKEMLAPFRVVPV